MIFGTLYHHHNLQILQQETTKMTTLVTHMSSEATLTSSTVGALQLLRGQIARAHVWHQLQANILMHVAMPEVAA